MPEVKRQLFHLLHQVDVTHDARYNPVSKTYSPRLEIAPATFAVTWPDGTPCGLVEIYLLHLWRSGEASIQPDGGSLRATVAKLTPLVRHCWSLKTDFWELEDADLQQLVADLQAEKNRRKPLERARNNNTVREIIAAAGRFLLWLQEHVVLDPSLIGVGRDFRIPLAERRVRDYRGRTKLVRVSKLRTDPYSQAWEAVFCQVQAISWRPAGESRGQGAWPAFTVGARSQHVVGVAHRAAFCPGNMFAIVRQVAGQVRRAGAGGHDAHASEGLDHPLLLAGKFGADPQGGLVLNIHAGWIKGG